MTSARALAGSILLALSMALSTSGGARADGVLDSFVYDGGHQALPQAIAVDRDDRIFVAGAVTQINGASPQSGDHWLVRRSADHGGTWTTVDDFQAGTGLSSIALGMAASPATGSLFAVGYATDDSGEAHLRVRRSKDGGNTWEIAFQHQLASTGFSSAAGASIGADGAIYVSGIAVDSVGLSHGFVHSSRDDGMTWTSTDLTPSGAGLDVRRVYVSPRGDLFAMGFIRTADPNQSAVIFRSQDQGASWKLVDAPSDPLYTTTMFQSLFDDSGLTVVVLGTAYENASHFQKSRILARRSIDGGDHWETAELFPAEGATFAKARDGLYVGGKFIIFGKEDSQALVQVSEDLGATWTTDELTPGPESVGASASAGALDNEGRELIIGTYVDSGQQTHWCVLTH